MKKLLKVIGLLVAVVLIAAGSLVAWASYKMSAAREFTYDVAPLDLTGAKIDLAVGERIAQVRNGCVDCHGPDLSGRTMVDDPGFGKISGANITPAALSSWSDGEIARAIRHGIGKTGHALVLMPSHEYHRLSRDDLASLVAYLRTVPAVQKENLPIELGPVAKILFSTGKVPTLLAATTIDHSEGFVSKPEEAPTREFGRYLIASACIGCHRPALTGGPIPGAPPEWLPAADITKLGSWTQAQFVAAMREGKRPDGSEIRFPMPIALTSKMNDTELAAMWEFLKAPEAL